MTFAGDDPVAIGDSSGMVGRFVQELALHFPHEGLSVISIATVSTVLTGPP